MLGLPHVGAVAPVRYPLAVGDTLRACLSRPAKIAAGVFTASGEQAIELALQGLLETESDLLQPAVIIPDFICPAVPRAVQALGLTPKYVALDPRTWFYDLNELADACRDGNCVVIIVAYFGLLPNLDRPQTLFVREILRDVPIIEDLAQAFGLTEMPAWSNAGGFRTFSFGPGKSLPMNGGGLVVGRSEKTRNWLRSAGANSPRYAWIGNLASLVVAQLQSLLTHRILWWLVPFPDQLRRAAHGANGPTMAWPKTAYVSTSHCSLMREIGRRRQNARQMAAAIGPIGGAIVPGKTSIDTGASLRFPIIFADRALAANVKRNIDGAKLIKGPNDWRDYNSGTSNADDIADRLVTLPTYSGSERVQRISVDIIRACCRRTASVTDAAEIAESVYQ